jgi:hypothetical protein
LSGCADVELGLLHRLQPVASTCGVRRVDEASTLQRGTAAWTGFGS